MLNKDIIKILGELRADIPDFYALQNLVPKLAENIAYWVKEDRFYHAKKTKTQKKK